MIWIVSDRPHTRDTLVPLIAARRYNVHPLACGEEVRKRMRFATPRLIIVDCGFPASFDVLVLIRAEQRGRHIPVILFGEDTPPFKSKSARLGADAYVVKQSLDWDRLLQEIFHFVGPPPTP